MVEKLFKQIEHGMDKRNNKFFSVMMETDPDKIEEFENDDEDNKFYFLEAIAA